MQLPQAPSFSLSGKRALVTGAGRGIGQAIAAGLAQAGAAVTLIARTTAEIEQVAQEISKAGGKAKAVALDITDLEKTAALVNAEETFDILVNNAGTNIYAPFLDVQIKDFDTMVNLNQRALFFTSQAVAKKLIASGMPGSIINISSQMGIVGGPNRSAYCGTKHAVEGMTKAMAIELGPHNIRVNTICPTFIETEMSKKFITDPTVKQGIVNKIKLNRLGRVEDIMGGVVYLASDAAALVTGTALVIDGGWTAE
ncbi:MAG: SDR family NAD(P)-dependent oxidoreductase [Bdellovibrionales bacterium]